MIVPAHTVTNVGEGETERSAGLDKGQVEGTPGCHGQQTDTIGTLLLIYGGMPQIEHHHDDHCDRSPAKQTAVQF